MKFGGRQVLAAAICCAAGLAASRPAQADTLIFKSGRTLQAQVERYTDGAFWVRSGRQTVVFYPEDIEKIVFDPAVATKPPAPDTSVNARSGGSTESAGSLARTAEVLSGIPSAEAVSGDDVDVGPDTGLAIVNYQAVLSRGIFQIVGEVENRAESPARYVKVTVTLFDEDGKSIARNFSYLLGKDPNLAPRARRGFRVSFLNPPTGVTKYKIRVESSQF